MDGSLIVSYQVGNYESIRNILKSWIPHILILEPEEFKKELLADVKGWVEFKKELLADVKGWVEKQEKIGGCVKAQPLAPV